MFEKSQWRRLGSLIAVMAVLLGIGSAGRSSAMDFEVFKDPEDGALDLSEWLMNRHGFLPVPIIVTEPAIGPGLGLAAVFFHGGFGGKAAGGDSDRMLPPSVTAAAAAYTSNGTWFVGGGHFGSWKQDTVRYAGFAGLINLNIDFFAEDNAVSFNIDGGFLLQEAKFRIGDSDFFLGGKWIFFDSTSIIDQAGGRSDDFPEIGEDGFKSTNSGLGAVAYYDSRDNIFTPDTGQEAVLEVLRYDKAIGGDFDYWHVKLQAISYHTLHPKFVLLNEHS